MPSFEVEFTDGSHHIHKEKIENVDGYRDTADGKWIDFIERIESPGDTQVRRFPASRVIGIKRLSE